MHRCLVVAPLLALFACASLDPWGHKRDLEDAQRSYTRMVRWGDFEKASQWVDPDHLERFLEEYPMEDGWRPNALAMLEQIG